MAEVTGRPVITQMAQRLDRKGVDEMFAWDRDRKLKVFNMKRLQMRETREREQQEMAKAGKYLN
jgi:hypothetical protein